MTVAMAEIVLEGPTRFWHKRSLFCAFLCKSPFFTLFVAI
jgi:hypothetical protein